MNVAKLQPIHAVVANAPLIISVLADQGYGTNRFFYGTGAPSSSTLLAGNGKYNAALHGWIISAQLSAAGTGYVVGDSLTVGLATIIVDAIGAGGVIVDFHVSAYGNYSSTAYPSNAVSASGGTGSGATFNLNWPQPDFYIDMTTPTAPVLYVCTGAGSNSGSTWAQISGGGGGGYVGTWSDTTAYFAGQSARVQSTAVVGGVQLVPGVYGCILNVPASVGSPATGNLVPQYPEPTSGSVYWQLIAFGVQTTTECSGGTGGHIYINASGPF